MFVDDINKNGGVDGRKIVPVYKKYPPIPGGKPDPLSLCTSFTEDDKVFAVLGVFIDFTGQGQKCLTKEHNVIHIGHELDQPWIDEAPGGLMLTPDAHQGAGVAPSLVNLLAETGKLKGKTVAVVGDKNNESRVNDVIVPALKKAKAKTGSTRHPEHHRHRHHRRAGAGRQLHREVEDRGRQHRVPGRQPRLGEAVRRVDQGGAAEGAARHRHRHLARPGQGRAERRASKPNPYEGMLSGTGLTQSERWANKSPLLQQCVDIYEKATGETVPGPDEREGRQRRQDRSTPTRRSPTPAATCSCSRHRREGRDRT